MTGTSWAPLLRIARRDAARARGRSALIVAMILLPVMGLTAADVVMRSGQLDPAERAARELGAAQARVTWAGGQIVQQAPDPKAGYVSSAATADSAASATPPLPAGYRVLSSRSAGAVVRTRAGSTYSPVTELAVGDPALRGRYRIEQGRAATAPDEVAVSRHLFSRLGVPLGGTATMGDPAVHLTLVGVIDQVGQRGTDQVWAPPGTPLDQSLRPPVTDRYLVGSRPVTWTDVLALNARGYLVTSRAVLLHPPPRAAVPFYRHESVRAAASAASVIIVVGIVLAVGLALLEVILLAGAAFAVGTRRQERWLGLLSVAGGEPRHSRRVVLAGGVVLGALGSVAGVGLGLGLAGGGLVVLGRWTTTDFGHFDARPLELAGIALLGVLTGVAAAALPARAAGRLDPVAALTGRRGQTRTPRRVPAVGVALLAVGVGLAALGSSLTLARTTSGQGVSGSAAGLLAGLIATGAGLAQIGLIVCSPALVGLAGRWSGRFPLPLRLALRDAARHRARSAPAVAAVLTAVAGSVAITLVVAATDAKDRRAYVAPAPAGSVLVQLDAYGPGPAGAGSGAGSGTSVAAALAALEPVLPPFTAYPIRSLDSGNCSPSCAYVTVLPATTPDGAPAAALSSGTVAVGTADALPVLAGVPAAAARDVLSRGGLVSFDPSLVRNGTATIGFSDAREVAAATSRDGMLAHRIQVPAVYVKASSPAVGVVVSESLARRLPGSPAVNTVVLHPTRTPTQSQEDAANAALPGSHVRVERGYQSRYGTGLLALVLGTTVITLGAAGISTGLAQADARADHATLLAVGATPRVRRSLAAAQALAIAGLGSLLGLLSGFVPALAYVGAVQSLTLVLPWATLAMILVGIPALACASAYLLTRSRLPLERRMAT